MRETHRNPNGRLGLSVTLFAVLSLLFLGMPAFAVDELELESWEEAHDVASSLTADIRVDGQPFVVQNRRYDPDARIVHDQGADIDYPVELNADAWQTRLSDMAYYVLREDGTERAFSNPMYEEKRAGIYYSRASGQPLFSSEDKYRSGTGWPSFTKPIAPDAVAYMWDNGLFSRRIEVIDTVTGSHLGHVFPDGPEPTGQRYCMNAAALIFVPEGEDPPPLLVPEGRELAAGR